MQIKLTSTAGNSRIVCRHHHFFLFQKSANQCRTSPSINRSGHIGWYMSVPGARGDGPKKVSTTLNALPSGAERFKPNPRTLAGTVRQAADEQTRNAA